MAGKEVKTYGQIAYEAYCDFVDWKSVKGDELPSYENQEVRIRQAWNKAADAVLFEAASHSGKKNPEVD